MPTRASYGNLDGQNDDRRWDGLAESFAGAVKPARPLPAPNGGRKGPMRPGHTMKFFVLTASLLLAPAWARALEDDVQDAPVTIATLKSLLAAFNAHDLDSIMGYFAEDCVLLMPRGPEPEGRRFVGKSAVREGLASRFAGLPDVHYSDDQHWVAGNLGVSTWLLTGTTRTGEHVRVRGVDLLEFRGNKVTKKDSYWKIVEK
jgi:ketosteroid isomerase-like protein